MFAPGLDFPTNLAFAPDGRLFFTEKETGRVRVVEGGRLLPDPFLEVPSTEGAETGLLGIALHPGFPDQPWLYLYYSSAEAGRNLLVRTRADGDRGTAPETLLEGPSVTPFHLGGDVTFGTDGKLYVVLGDALSPGRAQDPGDVPGRVLRLNDDGSVPEDNPLGPGNPTYSLGHRNSFGLCADPLSGRMWQTENGPDAHDEVNLLRPGGNYGWPEVLGDTGDPRFEDPLLDFPEIIIPTGCAVYTGDHLGPRSGGALFFGDFQGRLHRVELTSDRAGVTAHGTFLDGLPGITDVQMGPDGRLYLATRESIVRLPRRIPARSTPSPAETTAPSPPASPPPEPMPVAGGDQDGGVWIAVAASLGALGALGVAAAVWVLSRRRRSPSPPWDA